MPHDLNQRSALELPPAVDQPEERLAALLGPCDARFFPEAAAHAAPANHRSDFCLLLLLLLLLLLAVVHARACAGAARWLVRGRGAVFRRKQRGGAMTAVLGLLRQTRVRMPGAAAAAAAPAMNDEDEDEYARRWLDGFRALLAAGVRTQMVALLLRAAAATSHAPRSPALRARVAQVHRSAHNTVVVEL